MNVGDTEIYPGLDDDWYWEHRCEQVDVFGPGTYMMKPVRRLTREEMLAYVQPKIRKYLATDANVTPQRISKKTDIPVGLVLEALGTMDGKEIVLSRVKGKWFARLKR